MPDNRVIALIVGGNEAHRYLTSMLHNVCDWADESFYYDDGSTDGSLDIARCQCNYAYARPPGSVSFLEHEGRFRQCAWDAMQMMCRPEQGAWIFAIDTDEIVQAPGWPDVRRGIDFCVEVARLRGAVAVTVPIPEVFDVVDHRPMVRVDGLWPTIAAPRLFAWKPDGVYADKQMGCGSGPSYVATGHSLGNAEGLRIFHYGYAHPQDRAAKYQRYAALANHGHNPDHIDSIRRPPELVAHDEQVPMFRAT